MHRAKPLAKSKYLPLAKSKYLPSALVDLPDRMWPSQRVKRPIWLSTDLRDGNQSLPRPMDFVSKHRMFRLLTEIGFKQIEIGFPVSSPTEFTFCRELIERGMIPEDVTISCLTTAKEEHIRRTTQAVEGSRAIVHIYNATDPVSRKHVFHKSQDQVVEMAVGAVTAARKLLGPGCMLEYSLEHFSTTELEFSKRVIDAVTRAWGSSGAPDRPMIINLPATVERSTPNVFADQVEWIHRNIEDRDAVVLSVHPHNDRGTAVAAAELALMAGADRVEGCLFGNGERTGNVDLVTLALNMYTQGLDPELDITNIDDIARTYSELTGMTIHPRHPYVGELVYTSFSGTHQDAIQKVLGAGVAGVWVVPYIPLDPQDVGRTYEAIIRINSQSGKAGIAHILHTVHGITLEPSTLSSFAHFVKETATHDLISHNDLLQLYRTFAFNQSTSALSGRSGRNGRNGRNGSSAASPAEQPPKPQE